MPRRDYAHSSQNKGIKTILVIALIILLLALSAFGLWFLVESISDTSSLKSKTPAHTTQHSSLPSRPQEVYSYIRDLETREIPVNKNEEYAKQQALLTAKQEKLLNEKKLEEQRLLEQERKKAEQTETAQTAQVAPPTEPQKAITTPNKAVEEKQAEEKRLAEQKKQASVAKESIAKEKEAKLAQPKEPVNRETKATKSNDSKSSVSKFGLQCGAFKNKAQAENMQARLMMSGYNARINSSADWNRVVVGPLGDRAAAVAALANAKTIGDCVIIGM